MPHAASISWASGARAMVDRLLAADGVRQLDDAEPQLAAYLGLVREWNGLAHLVSERDESDLVERHLIDSLSIAGAVQAGLQDGYWLDLGSGGGFPAIPVKLVLPNAPLVMVERSAKKVGFLRKAVARLGLHDAEIVHASFPEQVPERGPDVITMRAIERPERVVAAALELLAPGGELLALQREDRMTHDPTFHVEHVRDGWTDAGLRRGALLRVRRK